MQAPPEDNRIKPFGPFGPPDGASEALDDPLESNLFVSFTRLRPNSPLTMAADDRSVRVIVGRKGSGKTLYLRRLRASATKEPSVYATKWQANLPSTREIIRVCDWAGSADASVELWQGIWRAAIVRALTSVVLCERRLGVEKELADELRSYSSLTGTFKFPQTIYGQVRSILHKHGKIGRLHNYLDDPEWEDVEHLLDEALRTTQPVCFYLDSLDDNFHHSPGEWLLCQKALFLVVVKLLDPSNFGPRLHVVIGVRDVVFSSLQNEEHATKLVGASAIRQLEWDCSAVRFFLREKIAALPDSLLMRPEATDPVERWLGQPVIQNGAAVAAEEPLEDYLLRHTRLIPRDIVVLGNRLCETVDFAKAEGHPYVSDSRIRQVVREVSEVLGREQLTITVNHLTANKMPRYAADHDYEFHYTGERTGSFEAGNALQTELREHLIAALGALGRNRFARSGLDQIEEEMAKMRGPGDVGSVMWQQGLLGYVDGPVETTAPVFYEAGRRDVLRLPRQYPAYALHPILIDAVPNLRGVGAVVRPW